MHDEIPIRSEISDRQNRFTLPWVRWLQRVDEVYRSLRDYGPSGNRPTRNLWVGRQYFDTDLGYPIWWSGSVWVGSSTTGVPPPAPTPAPTPAPGAVLPAGFSAAQVGPLTFEDTFDSALDPNRWRLELGYQTPYAGADHQVTGGELQIWNTIQSGSTWHSGRAINTDGPGNQYTVTPDTDVFRFGQRYGIFEAEMRVPTGRSNWPAFWLYGHPGARRAEIDIFEYFGGDVNYNSGPPNYLPRNYAGTYWDGNNGSESIQGQCKLVDALGYIDLSAAYHKYAVRWAPGSVTWYFDGQAIGSVNSAPDVHMFLIISMGTQQGQSYNGATYTEPDSTTSQSSANPFAIKAIRAWGLPDNSHSVVGTLSGP